MVNLHGTTAYSVVAALAFAESALLVGFVLPGETAVILGGVLASRGAVLLPLMMVVAMLAAISGDSVGYEIGRRLGPRLVASRFYAAHRAGLERAMSMLQRVGGRAVLFGRFTAVLRAAMPAMAGIAGLRYRSFLLWNAAGGIVWAGGFTLAGYAVGNSYAALGGWAGRAGLVAVAAVVVVSALIMRTRRHRPSPDAAHPILTPPPPEHQPSVRADGLT